MLLPEEIDLHIRLQKQSAQIAEVQNARKQYEQSLDLDAYIAFWENLWSSGGLLFRGSSWHFELCGLYVKAGRYEDAIAFLQILKANSDYSDRATREEARIKKLLRKK